MLPFTRKLLSFAAAGALVALTTASTPARADEMVQNLGPVGPNEPILATIGSEHLIAFYLRDDGHCAIHAVVWDNGNADTGTPSASRARINLNPGQIAHIDSAENESINLRCADDAANLGVVDISERIVFRLTE